MVALIALLHIVCDRFWNRQIISVIIRYGVVTAAAGYNKLFIVKHNLALVKNQPLIIHLQVK